ncbi:hypothetical protein DPPLL_27410 [Desulfofustis limnaeus]|uniref:Uncharacterized protein n=1 Tax=Desulfofustis limnaeus TaxID=2740163 RepID=A0ABM7WBR2_9BACT|nr:hypothetical protein DPPLL_27410 [Desulfofustis limnaeus]
MESLADLLPTGLGQYTTVGIGQCHGYVRQGRKIIENPLQGFDLNHIDKTIVLTHFAPLFPVTAPRPDNGTILAYGAVVRKRIPATNPVICNWRGDHRLDFVQHGGARPQCCPESLH